jgi:hypothetical protein
LRFLQCHKFVSAIALTASEFYTIIITHFFLDLYILKKLSIRFNQWIGRHDIYIIW